MRNILILRIFVTAILLFTSCDKNTAFTTETDNVFNYNNIDWKSKKINHFINDINYTATEVPLQYYLLKSTGGDSKKVDSIYKANNRERIVEVEFQHSNQTDLLLEEYTNKSYDDAVKYMAFTIEKDFMVVTQSNDSINCAGVLFERNFKVAPFKRALLYFNNINPNDNIKLIYQDHLFGNGIIKFDFKGNPIKL